MTLPTAPPILSELRNPTSPASQVAALRALKNEVIGNGQKKRSWIKLGILGPIARILNTSKASGKRRESNGTRSSPHRKAALARSDEEEARFQAIVIVGSLAYAKFVPGGSASNAPIRDSAVIPSLLALLSSPDTTSRIVLATLRTLNTLADASALEKSTIEDYSRGLINSLYTQECLTSLVQILSQTSSSHTIQHQISLSAALIAKTCYDENQRKLLVRAGVLEALASRVAAVVRTTDFTGCMPNTINGSLAHSESLPAMVRSWLVPVFSAIGSIVDTSRSRATIFLSTPALTAVLSKVEADLAMLDEERDTSWLHNGYSGVRSPLATSRHLDRILPQIPSFASKSALPESASHPPIGASGTSVRHSYLTGKVYLSHGTIHGQASAQDEESPFISWLLYLARAESGVGRLMAAWVVGLFYRSGLIDKRRETTIAMLLVPLIVRILDNGVKPGTGRQIASTKDSAGTTDQIIQEQAPAILAMLTVDSLEIQRAAVDAGAIKRLAQLLKQSYDPLPVNATFEWTADSSSNDGAEDGNENLFTENTAMSAAAYRIMKVRESVLTALASIASIRDDYRTAIVEQGVVPLVIESLKTEQPANTADGSRKGTATMGPLRSPLVQPNPVSVILAACEAARSLSRSVHTLRTCLTDAGLTTPLVALLKHGNVKIRTAATAVFSNLVLEFSPMRDAIVEAGTVKILCDHAHSTDPELRLNSVWALKHLVVSAPGLLKKECLVGLGSGWLQQIFSSETGDSVTVFGSRAEKEPNNSTPLAMGTPNAAGEQVDLLNSTDGFREDVFANSGNQDDNGDSQMADSLQAMEEPNFEAQRKEYHQNRWRAPSRPADLIQIRKDDLALQQQGFEFLSNMFCGSDGPEMIDCVFEEIGQEKLFEILVSKLRPRLVNAFNRDRRSSENNVRQTQPPTDIVVSVCNVVLHIAAGLPRHRQHIISHPELLKLIVPLFSHSSARVRCCCAWIVINLTCTDDQSDQVGCGERVHALEKLGVMEKLRILQSDPETDVKERTKTAIHQMNKYPMR
ncbi:MAG: hypothetical protein Q9222_001712 [Ikaeria aurantiellina]